MARLYAVYVVAAFSLAVLVAGKPVGSSSTRVGKQAGFSQFDQDHVSHAVLISLHCGLVGFFSGH